MDLISRQAAIDYCEALMEAERVQQTDDWGYGRERYNQTEAIQHYIENMPSVQRKCEKCKWFSKEFSYKIGEQIATGFDICFWNRIYPMRVDRDFFCAHFQEDEE